MSINNSGNGSRYGANQYKSTAVKTASRGQIVIMLYEAAIQQISRAILAIDKKDVVAKGIAIGKAHDIVNELVSSLNFEVGGNIGRELEGLYNFVIRQLVAGNIEHKVGPLQSAKKILDTLLEGWRGAVAQNELDAAKASRAEREEESG